MLRQPSAVNHQPFRMKIKIDSKYCGPTGSGNGGYVSGMIAKAAHFPSQVTLRKPPPLDKYMELRISKDKVELLDGETLIGEAVPTDLEIEIPNPPTYEEAVEAAKNYSGHHEHPFPNCFVCGTNRKPDDGLNLFTGKIEDGRVASPWIPSASLSDDGKFINPEYYWAALDCPGAWTYLDPSRVIVLGRISAKVLNKIEVGKKYIVIGWPISIKGRKVFTGTAVFTEDGQLCSAAKATWIALK